MIAGPPGFVGNVEPGCGAYRIAATISTPGIDAQQMIPIQVRRPPGDVGQGRCHMDCMLAGAAGDFQDIHGGSSKQRPQNLQDGVSVAARRGKIQALVFGVAHINL